MNLREFKNDSKSINCSRFILSKLTCGCISRRSKNYFKSNQSLTSINNTGTHELILNNNINVHCDYPFDLDDIKFIDDDDDVFDEELDGADADRIRDAWIREESASTSSGITSKKDVTNGHITVTLADG
ncbi:hypothetical protein PV326_007303, partial [Microctonus aethiopoides]